MSDICTRFLIHFHLFRFYQMNSYVHKLSPAREMLFWSKKKFNFWKIYRFFRKRIFISSCFTLLILWKVNLHSFWKWGPQGSLQNLYFHKSLSLNLKILGCGDPRYKHENQEEDGFGEICLYCITICAITT